MTKFAQQVPVSLINNISQAERERRDRTDKNEPLLPQGFIMISIEFLTKKCINSGTV
jgi:hypothetical protein